MKRLSNLAVALDTTDLGDESVNHALRLVQPEEDLANMGRGDAYLAGDTAVETTEASHLASYPLKFRAASVNLELQNLSLHFNEGYYLTNLNVKKKVSEVSSAGLPSKIKELRAHLGFKQRDLAQAIGVSQGAVGQWEIGRSAPDAKHLLKMAEIAGADDRAWLREAAGVKDAKSSDDVSHAFVPLLRDAAAAGTPRAIDEREIQERLPVAKHLVPRNGKVVAVKVSGDSMEPIILDGYTVFIDTSERDPDKLNGWMVAARDDGAGVTIKWLRLQDNEWMLIPQHTSEEHPIRAMKEHGDWSIVGKVLFWIGMPKPPNARRLQKRRSH